MIFELSLHRVLRTVSNGLIQTTDISFPRNREGSLIPLKTLWRSTMGVQPPSTLPTLCIHQPNTVTSHHEEDDCSTILLTDVDFESIRMPWF